MMEHGEVSRSGDTIRIIIWPSGYTEDGFPICPSCGEPLGHRKLSQIVVCRSCGWVLDWKPTGTSGRVESADVPS